ncbi:acyl-CoA dehydrogenase [Mycobacterium colombiense]|uniref:acyl-CoA dehydrogenase n=1 Tax=Mycobacterium colombiense TaxID=339268 RepID=UPI0007EFE961|nr:acyl-CoA dehydrogenase [Mycobacterium colombiense]OBK68555.1 acyl-CoA dehydrogenase [Mycobacterium colombiense]
MRGPLAGGVFVSAAGDDDAAELHRLVEDIGRRAFEARAGRERRPEQFDEKLWRTLEETGLARLTSTPDLGAGPTEIAVVLRGLARYAAAVPIAETDLLAAWLAGEADVAVPESGPLTVAPARAKIDGPRLIGVAPRVPWTRAAVAVLLVAETADGLYVGKLDDIQIHEGHNLAGEPRDRISFDLALGSLRQLNPSVGEQFRRRGALARCVQILGALDAAAEQSVAHTRERVQFGRPLSQFQAVQHALAAMAGEIETARAAATLAVAAAADYGFDADQTDYAITVAKVVVGRAVEPVTRIAQQLHGAIGATAEHSLGLSTLRAQSWSTEFGSTAEYARRLGRMALAAARDQTALWDLAIGIHPNR